MKVNVDKKTLIYSLNTINNDVCKIIFSFDGCEYTEKVKIISYLEEIKNDLIDISKIIGFKLEDKLDKIKNDSTNIDVRFLVINSLNSIKSNIHNSLKYLNFITDRDYVEKIRNKLIFMRNTFEKLKNVLNTIFHFEYSTTSEIE